jgi:hypothetical protein
MLDRANPHPRRRDFLGQLGAAAAALFAPPIQAEERHVPIDGSPWDLSWVDRLKDVSYRVVFDANDVSDGFALDLTAMFLDQYHEVYGTRDDQARAVIVMRQLGTPLALGDALWDRYAVGEEIKVQDPATHQPARRNPFLRAAPGASPEVAPAKLEALRARGTILLLCNIAANNWASRHATLTHRDIEEVRAEVRTGLAPGVILVPSGVFALIRAQNAGCALMRGA